MISHQDFPSLLNSIHILEMLSINATRELSFLFNFCNAQKQTGKKKENLQ